MFVVHVARDCVSGGSQLLPLGEIDSTFLKQTSSELYCISGFEHQPVARYG